MQWLKVAGYCASCALGWAVGEIIKWRREKLPRTLIDDEGNWESVNGGRVPMFCPKCGWPREYDEKLEEIICQKCKYSARAEDFDKKVQRA